MPRLRPMPIRHQLALGTVVASAIAVILLSVSFVAYDLKLFGETMVRRLSGEAEIVGLNSAAAILFRDPNAAEATLGALTAEPSVLSAAIYGTDERLFASYTRRGAGEGRPPPSLPPVPAAPGHAFSGGRLLVARPITFERGRIGTVLIQASLAERTSRLRRYAGIALLASVGAFAVAVLIASRVQRSLSRPILNLADTARRVSEEKDYAVRATAAGPDEIGEMVRTFNEMLENIERRESDLKDAHRALEKTLEERTTLYRQAEEGNRVKDQFLATLSHELRTPLNAIIGWSAILAGGELDEAAARRAVATINRNAKAQGKLIEDILDVSRIVSGKLNLAVGPVDLVAVIQAAVDAVKHAADAKQIRVQVVLDSRAGSVSADGDRLQQVFWNLLSNAIKFTPRGGRVYVRLSRRDTHVEVQVSDDGVGIKREFLPYVFERFRQADASSTRAFGGLGLGLAIVRHIVELHGGTVDAASEGEGRGATFKVTLPIVRVKGLRHRPPERPRGAQLTAAAAAGAVTGHLAGLTVLVVDDDHDSLDLLHHSLTQQGAEVVRVSSAPEAMAAIERRVPHVVVSDIEMPGEDGYTLIRKIRALPPERGGLVPAAALTAYARSEDRVLALQMGFQFHLAKPVDPAELVAVVSSLAARR